MAGETSGRNRDNLVSRHEAGDSISHTNKYAGTVGAQGSVEGHDTERLQHVAEIDGGCANIDLYFIGLQLSPCGRYVFERLDSRADIQLYPFRQVLRRIRHFA